MLLVTGSPVFHVASDSLCDHILMNVTNLNPQILLFRSYDVLANFLIAVQNTQQKQIKG